MSVTFVPSTGIAGAAPSTSPSGADPAHAHPADDSIAVLLSDVTRLFWRRLEAGLREAGLDFTAGEARTLVNVARQGGLRQSILAERMRIEPMTLVGFLDRLESRGLVVRLPDPADRRAKLIAPTDAAAEPVTRIHAVAAAVKAEVTAGLAESEVDVLREMLQRIRSNLDALALEPAPFGSKRSERKGPAQAFESGALSDRPDVSIRSGNALDRGSVAS